MKHIYLVLSIVLWAFIGSLTYGQSYTSGYPAVTGISQSTATLETNLTVGSYMTSFVVLPAGSAAPTITQVYNGQDASGTNVPAGHSGQIVVFDPATTYTGSISNLSVGTDYDLYCVSHFFQTNPIESSPTLVSFTTLTAPPFVSSYSPLRDATDISVNQVIILSFDRDVQFGTGTHAIRLRRVSDGSVFQSYSVNGGSTDSNLDITDNVLTINHSDFEFNTEYYVTISNGAIESLLGVPYAGLSLDHEWAFTTVAQVPTVTVLNPANSASGISLNQVLTVTFDMDIQFSPTLKSIRIRRTSDNSIFQSYLVEGALTDGTLSITDATLTINHIDFEDNTQYYIQIDDGAIQSLSGVSFPGFTANTDWTFTTIVLAPTISSYIPTQNAVNVGIDQALNLTFDQDVQFGAGPQVIRIRRVSDGSVFQSYSVDGGSSDGNLSITDATLTISHTDFENSTAYYVTVSNGAIESTSGVPFVGLSANTDWAFTSIAPPPVVATLNPTNTATGVAIDQNLSIDFDQNIQFSPTLKSIRIRRVSDNSLFQSYLVEGALTDPTLDITGSTLTISHNDFEENTQYYVLIDEGAIQSDVGVNFGGFLNTTDWTFTTLASAPLVASYLPIQNSVDVSIDQVLSLTFDKDIQFGAAPQVIRIRRISDGSVFQTYSVDGGSTDGNLSITNSTLTINHADFENNTAYYVTISDGAIESSSGVPFSGFSLTTDWTFTTIAQAPTVITLDPTSTATDVVIDKVLNITFDRDIQFGPTLKTIRILRSIDNSTFQSFLVEGGLTDPLLSITNATLSINHTDFEESTQYYILIDEGSIQSTEGVDFSGFTTNGDWTFTTGITPPVVITDGYTPAVGAVDVSISSVALSVDFDKNIEAGVGGWLEVRRYSDQTLLKRYRIEDGNSDAQVNITGAQLAINDATTQYLQTEEYYVLITNDAIRVQGGGPSFVGISDKDTWKFTTEAIPPFVATDGYSPAVDEVDVAYNSIALTLTFDQSIKEGATGGYIYVYRYSDDTRLNRYWIEFDNSDTQVSISGADLIINDPATSYEQGTQYYVTVASTAIQATSNDAYFLGIADKDTWKFTTLADPPVTTFNPANGAVSVNIQSDIIVTYDQAVRQVGGAEIVDPTSLVTFTYSGGSVPFSASINATKDVITINPNNDLISNTDYTVEVAAVESNLGAVQTGAQTTVFTTGNYLHWQGDASADVTDPANWDGSPVGAFSAIVGVVNEATHFYPDFTGTHTINSMIIEAGAHAKVSATGTLNITDLFELHSSNDPSTGNATFLNIGTVNLDPAAEVRVHQQISSEPYDYYVSSPVSGATPQSTGINGNAYRFVPDTKWVAMNPTDQFNAGEGYSVWSTAGTDLIFSGDINDNASYVFNCERVTAPYNNYGWNLLGNPYPASIDWIALTRSPEINNHFYLRHNDTGIYGVHNGSGNVNLDPSNPTHIPSLHAVWVQVNISETTGSVTIPRGAQTASRYTYLKSEKKMPGLRFTGINNDNKKDETLIAFSPEVSSGEDTYRSEKRYVSNNTSLLELYTLEASDELAINAYDDYIDGRAVNVGYKAGAAGTYYIELTGIENFSEEVEVKLEDLEEIKEEIMLPGEKYEFYTMAGKNNNRFVIHVKPALSTGIEDGELMQNVKVYNQNSEVYVQIPDLIDPKLELYDMSGKRLLGKQLNSGSLNKVLAPQKGVILVKVIAKEGVFTHKLFIK
ncbi:MAG: Ig-like domain-containing protein [Carboxylicivirga sp.]|jgi:hypothetical protein|nr:Ig-like domain-containing protein [Carboxylicivirga sp.]